MLDNMNKNNPFKVPENYFDNFQKEMMEKVQSTTTTKVVVPMWKKLMPWTAVAAIFCGAIISLKLLSPAAYVPNVPDTKTPQTGVYSGKYTSSSDDDLFLMYLEDEASVYSFNDVLLDQTN